VRYKLRPCSDVHFTSEVRTFLAQVPGADLCALRTKVRTFLAQTYVRDARKTWNFYPLQDSGTNGVLDKFMWPYLFGEASYVECVIRVGWA
jgi:hypothetical protein